MRHCPTTQVLSAFADKELAEEESIRVAAHLGRCSACSRALRQLRGVELALQSIPVTEAARSRVYRSLAASPRWWHRPIRIPLSAAAGLLLLLALSLALNGYWVLKTGAGKRGSAGAEPVREPFQVEVVFPAFRTGDRDYLISTDPSYRLKQTPIIRVIGPGPQAH